MTALPMPEPGRCTCRPVLVAHFVREALVGLEYRHLRSRGCTRPSEPVDVKTWRRSPAAGDAYALLAEIRSRPDPRCAQRVVAYADGRTARCSQLTGHDGSCS